MIKASIVGSTGYAGAELVRLLLRHPEVEINKLVSKSYVSEDFSSIYGNMLDIVDKECDGSDLERLSEESDVIFTATPQGYLSKLLTEDILKKAKVIDLSADYRLSDVSVYEKWYGISHGSPELIKKGIYGLCEIYRDDIKDKALVANPGCYTTCSILSLYPLVKEHLIDLDSVIIDAKSGTSGAGRSAKTANLFCEVNENIKAYGVATHRHTPEIEQELSIAAGEDVIVNFTPHLVPMNRGILVTAYASLKQNIGFGYPDKDRIREAYERYYRDECFIRLLPYGKPAETRWVEGSNYVDIGYTIDERTNRIVVMAAIDNLIKGAAGQAVQNMNILFGFDEALGLKDIALFP